MPASDNNKTTEKAASTTTPLDSLETLKGEIQKTLVDSNENNDNDESSLPSLIDDETLNLCPKLETILIQIFNKYSSNKTSLTIDELQAFARETNANRPDLKPSNDEEKVEPNEEKEKNGDNEDEESEDDLDDLTADGAFSEETLGEIFDNFDNINETELTRQGFLDMYHLQTIGDEDETWADLKAHGYTAKDL